MSLERRKALAHEIREIWAEQDAQDRTSSVAEAREVERLLAEIKADEADELKAGRKASSDAVNAMFRGGTKSMSDYRAGDGSDNFHDWDGAGQGIGDMFVKSEQWRKLSDPAARGQQWSTGAIEIPLGGAGYGTKGTLLEGGGAPGSGSGGGWVTTPHVVPGAVTKLFQRLTIQDLFPQQQVSTSVIRYMNEGTAVSAAAGVAEAGVKPESTLGMGVIDEPVKKVATTLTVSDEMLEDGGSSIQSYLNARLGLFVSIEVERQLVRGAGTNELVGLMAAGRGINIYAGGTAAGNKVVQAYKAMNGTRGSSFLEPSAWVIHPTDWQDMRLLTDTAGQFFGGGPFTGAYGNSPQVNGGGQVNGVVDYLWGKPVVVTTALGGAGTALVGAFDQGAMLGIRHALTVEVSNQHASYFASNLVMIRAEMRMGLCVYRPASFTEIRLA